VLGEFGKHVSAWAPEETSADKASGGSLGAVGE